MSTEPSEFVVRILWEGCLIASTDCVSEEDAWRTFRESTGKNDGYTVQILHEDRIHAEETNPDESGEI